MYMYVCVYTHTHTHIHILIQRTVHMGNLNCTTHQVWNVNLSNLTVQIFWCESKKFSTATWLVGTTQYSNPSVYEMHKLIPIFEIVNQFSLLWGHSQLAKHLVFPVPPLGYCLILFLLKCTECYGICEQFMLKQHCSVCHFFHSCFMKFTVLGVNHYVD